MHLFMLISGRLHVAFWNVLSVNCQTPGKKNPAKGVDAGFLKIPDLPNG
jgi:hypothetical protein